MIDKIGGSFITFSRNGKPFRNPMTIAKKMDIRPGDVVIDIGAYVGEFSLIAAARGAIVTAYEPTPETFAVLQTNSAERFQAINAAIVGDDRAEAVLYLSSGVGVTNSITKHKERSITVPAVNYLAATSSATVVKIDIEGGEYDLPITPVGSSIREILLEFHPVKDWIEKRAAIILAIESCGFECKHRPGFSHGWDYIGWWSRK